MKICLLWIGLFALPFISLAQDANTENKGKVKNNSRKNLVDSLDKLYKKIEILSDSKDSLVLNITELRDSLKEALEKIDNKDPKPKIIPQPLQLTTTLVGAQEWTIANVGGKCPNNQNESEDFKKWLKEKKFTPCKNDEEWDACNQKEVPAYFVVNSAAKENGFYFNFTGLKWFYKKFSNEERKYKIADYDDFLNLFKYVNELKLGVPTFKLIAGNPTSDEFKTTCSWLKQDVKNIYGLNFHPFSIYQGVQDFLENNAYVEFFSSYNEDEDAIVTVRITPQNMNQPVKVNYTFEEVKNSGFYIRLIKN